MILTASMLTQLMLYHSLAVIRDHPLQLCGTHLSVDVSHLKDEQQNKGGIGGFCLWWRRHWQHAKSPYASIPKPLSKKVKQYIRVMLCSSCSRFRKTEWNSQTVHWLKTENSIGLPPTASIQALLDTVGPEHNWFSILDQCKAYHQGYMAEVSCQMTAFIFPWGLWVDDNTVVCNVLPAFQHNMKDMLDNFNDCYIPYLNDTLFNSK